MQAVIRAEHCFCSPIFRPKSMSLSTLACHCRTFVPTCRHPRFLDSIFHGSGKRNGIGELGNEARSHPRKTTAFPVSHLRRGGRRRDIARPGTSRVIWRSGRQRWRSAPRQTHPAYSPDARQRRLEKPASSPVSRFHFSRVRKTEWKRGMSGRESGPDAASKDGLSFSLLLAPPVETQATTRCEETRLGP